MNRNQKRRLEREQLKSKKTIEVSVATTLQEALQHAEINGIEGFGYEGMFYIKVDNRWHEQNVVPELLQFPQYKKVYDEFKNKKDIGELMAKDLLLAMFTTNIGNGGEYDISNQI
jgi:hypothetical protein